LNPNERVYIVDASSINTTALLDAQVISMVGSSQAKIVFQPDTYIVKTFQFKIFRFQGSSERQLSQYDLISHLSPFVYGPNLTFDWEVENLSPKIVSVYPSLADATVSPFPSVLTVTPKTVCLILGHVSFCYPSNMLPEFFSSKHCFFSCCR